MFITRQLRCLLRNLLPRCAAYLSIISPDLSIVKDIFNYFILFSKFPEKEEQVPGTTPVCLPACQR